MLRSLLLVLLLASPSFAAVARLPSKWQGSLKGYFASPQPDWHSVKALSGYLGGLDPNAPETRRMYPKVYAALQAEAAALLAAPLPDTEEGLAAAHRKYRFLSDASVRDFLTEDQRTRVAVAHWAFNNNLWDAKGVALSAKIAGIAKALEAAAPSAMILPIDDPGLRVVAGDVTKTDADAVLATIELDGMCTGGVNKALACAVEPHVKQAMPLSAGQVVQAPKAVLIVDDWKRPLSDVVLDGLRAADAAGHRSVALPVMRTGFVFGAVERSYDEVVAAVTDGVRRFLAGARTTLKDITLVVHNRSELLDRFKGAWSQRDRSLRKDMRAAELSGKGYSLKPRPREVKDRRSPIYRSLLKPWSLDHLRDVHLPVRIGTIRDKKAFSLPTASVLNMPLKMLGTDVRVPAEHEQFREFLQAVIDHEKAVNPDYDQFYMYFTVDQFPVKKGSTHRKPGVHIDGVQGARYKVKLPPEHLYSASDKLGTVFYDQRFDLSGLDPAKQHVHAELERQADESKAWRAPDYGIFFWDSYSVHRADVAEEDLVRTFIRVEFSKKKYDAEGDTVNPLFDYDWERVSRPIPADLDDKPIKP